MKPEKAKLVVQGLKEAGVDFTAGVPDAQFIQVYKMLEEDPDIRYVGTANEAEAAGVGYGAWFGGKKPALILAPRACWWRPIIWRASIFSTKCRCWS